MPLRPSRMGRAGVVGGPVAKAAVVGAAVCPGRRPLPRPLSWGQQSPGPPGRQGRGRRRRRHAGPTPSHLATQAGASDQEVDQQRIDELWAADVRAMAATEDDLQAGVRQRRDDLLGKRHGHR